MVESKNNTQIPKTPQVSFGIEMHKKTNEQHAAGVRLFRRLIDRVQKSEYFRYSSELKTMPELGESARVDGGSRHPLESDDE
jgi:hypothetical protein